MPEEQRARILIEVVAGVIPKQPMPEYTKQWAITSDTWYAEGKFKDKPADAQDAMLQVYGHAQEYMRTLWNPKIVNWVEMTWIYL